MDEFLKIFKEHEDELEVACPDFAIRVQELMQADIVANNRVGSRYSKHFSEDITMRCGKPRTQGGGGSQSNGDQSGDGSNAQTPGAQGTDQAEQSGNLHNPPSLSLEQRIKLQLEEKMAEDREMSQMVASMEAKILENEESDTVEVKLDNGKVVNFSPKFVEMCSDCGERHVHEERECHFCGEVHEGCCDL